MSIPPRTEARTAFGITTPSDMLAKLKREVNRVADASFLHDELVDHGNQCAITAWHITDWVWRARFENDTVAQDDLVAPDSNLRKKGGGKYRDIPRWFKEYLTRECPELALCQDIANGFKHVIATIPERRESPGVVNVTASASVAPSEVFELGHSVLGYAGLGGPGFTPEGTMYRLKIEDSHGIRHDAVDVFNRVVAFWNRFLHMNHLA